MKKRINPKLKLNEILKKLSHNIPNLQTYRISRVFKRFIRRPHPTPNKTSSIAETNDETKQKFKKHHFAITRLKHMWSKYFVQKLPFSKISRFLTSRFPILKKRLVAISIGMLIVLIPTVLLILRNPDRVRADWFDDNWHFRKKITITNSGSADSNKKVLVELDTAALISESKLQNTCADARFTDVNGQPLKYFIDSGTGACNTASTDFYVLIPTINSGSTILYFYYGNPYAPAVSEVFPN